MNFTVTTRAVLAYLATLPLLSGCLATTSPVSIVTTTPGAVTAVGTSAGSISVVTPATPSAVTSVTQAPSPITGGYVPAPGVPAPPAPVPAPSPPAPAPTPAPTPEPTIFIDVDPTTNLQVSSAGDIMLVTPYRDNSTATTTAYIAQAITNGYRWIYTYDELFWNGYIAFGLDDSEAVTRALAVRAAGLTNAITSLPEIVMHPSFSVSNINAFDVIGIDIYPSIGIDWNSYGYTYGDGSNLYTTMLAGSIIALRAKGYTGQIWYVYQDFAVNVPGKPTDPGVAAKLVKQAATIALAPSLGVTGLIAYDY